MCIFVFYIHLINQFNIIMRHLFQHGLLVIAFILGMFSRLDAQSTQLVVYLNDGSEQTYTMTEHDRLYFEGNDKLVIEEGEYKNTVKILLDDIRKLTCYETVGVAENEDLEMGISPNPVHNVLAFTNMNESQGVRIYTLDGRLVKSFEATEGLLLDISDLSIGVYLVRTESKTFKMIKL